MTSMITAHVHFYVKCADGNVRTSMTCQNLFSLSKKGGYVFRSVCLFTCPLRQYEHYQQILMKFCGVMECTLWTTCFGFPSRAAAFGLGSKLNIDLLWNFLLLFILQIAQFKIYFSKEVCTRITTNFCAIVKQVNGCAQHLMENPCRSTREA